MKKKCIFFCVLCYNKEKKVYLWKPIEKQKNMKNAQNTENQAITTFNVVSELTANFKKEYLQIVENWLQIEFKRKIQIISDFKLNVEPFLDKYGRLKSENLPEGVLYWEAMELSKKFQAITYEIHTCARLMASTPEKFDNRAYKSFSQIEAKIEENKSFWIASEMKKTSKSFDNSLMKIANAITNLDMNLDKMNVKSVLMELGIDITLTDGNKQVHAFTIIACGEIVRPHFRFLIKSKTL
jgi:hypothetical protein